MPDNNAQNLKLKRYRELVAYFGDFVRKEGIGKAVSRTGYFLQRRLKAKFRNYLPSKQELERQRGEDFTGWPTISVVVPVFQPDAGFFMALLESLESQTYPNWQLCLADGSPDKTPVASAVAQLEDARVCLIEVQNKGIAANTNAAIALATGEYIAFADHDDVLAPHALYHMAKAAKETGAGLLYSDEALFRESISKPSVGHFKPDYSPQYLLSCNYICHLVCVKRTVVEEVGGLQEGFDGAQDHDFLLRVLEKTGGAVHIPRVLYYWRQHAASTSTGTGAKPYVAEAARKAIDGHLARTGVKGKAVDGLFPSTYKVEYEIQGTPLVSIIIPSYEHPEDLRRCLNSIYAHRLVYPHFEVVVVENNSKKPETFEFYETLPQTYEGCRVVNFGSGPFNFSAVCNFGAAQAKGEYLLFLNNDTEVITPAWLPEMLGLAQQPEIGAVGAMLYYEDDTVQHAGVVVGLGGYAGHSHKYALRGKSGYMFRQAAVNEFSAVTAACVMVRRNVFDLVNGFDETLSVAYNDVDLCLRIGKAGKSIVFTPYAELYHYESKSRGSDEKGEAKKRADSERAILQQRYGKELLHDRFYNPNLTLDREDFSENDVLPEE